MRSIFYVGWAFVVFGAVAGCGEILGIESWEDRSAGQDTKPGTVDTPAGGAGGSGGNDNLACSNGVQDGTETGVDCGGDACEPCESGYGCNADSDCVSNFCPETRGYCAGPDGRVACGMEGQGGATCADCLPNASESDVDCGGDDCLPCRVDRKCTHHGECWSGICGTSLLCLPGPKGTHCFSNGDCASGSCGTLDCTTGTCCQ